MSNYLDSRILGKIISDEVQIGKGVVIEEDVIIGGKGGPAKKVVLGDFCYIGKGTKILAPEFRLGDYSKLHANSFAHGDLPLQVGRNCWIGGNVVLDSLGGLDIDDNVGIGAQSQIWTHIKFGDIVEGCRFHSKKYMHIQKDAWFVGHCIVSPVEVGKKSMALVGSVITRDMEPNHVYAGVPAIDITEKTGPQFENRSIEEKATKLQEIVDQFFIKHPSYKGLIKVVLSSDEYQDGVTCFDVSNRTYTKNYSQAEIEFLKTYVPLVKFTPTDSPEFYPLQATLNNDN
jgi:acetyltransferase-like isoleucine patch superfamily enzyme